MFARELDMKARGLGEYGRDSIRAILRDFSELSLLLGTKILMKKISSNTFSKWLFKYSHPSFHISR